MMILWFSDFSNFDRSFSTWRNDLMIFFQSLSFSSDAAENQTSLFLANKATKLDHVTTFLDTDWFSNKSKQRKITEKISRTEAVLLSNGAAPSFSLAQHRSQQMIQITERHTYYISKLFNN